MTLSGTFGVCGVRNNNQRVYEAGNYGRMVTEMQGRIKQDGAIPGELEHPQTMNVTLENVSHKIVDINIDENGVVSGTIQLLNTPKGKIAQAIVEGGLPLFVSSRAMGQVDKGGKVTLEKISTYDLVGTPGFSQARMHLNESQVYESLSDNIFIISENESNENNNMDTPQELLERFAAMEARITELEAENQSLRNDVDEAVAAKIDLQKLANGIQNWVINEYSESLQKWITEDFGQFIQEKAINESKKNFVKEIAPKIQQWVVEDFGAEIEKWVCEQYSPQVENWVIRQVAPGIQNWLTEHFTPEIEKWVTESYGTQVKDLIAEGLKDTKAGQLKSITETLSMLEGLDIKKPDFGTRRINENKEDEPLFIAQMPESARVQWNLASQEVKESIKRRAQLFDFTNEGAIGRFWEGIKFEEVKPAPGIYEGLENITDERERAIRMQLRRHRAGL
jgi:hypothetical protein